ncbi:hypothetical protein TNCV_3130531 [Trichonephila clavipes]|nr:hypothetical protein TNCV_3130531 [Trichonephila clavipes]
MEKMTEISARKEEQRNRKMKSLRFHSLWDVPKDEQRCGKNEKGRMLYVDCLLPGLVYDINGEEKHNCITPRRQKMQMLHKSQRKGEVQ